VLEPWHEVESGRLQVVDVERRVEDVSLQPVQQRQRVRTRKGLNGEEG
jgi:hypothetical protein